MVILFITSQPAAGKQNSVSMLAHKRRAVHPYYGREQIQINRIPHHHKARGIGMQMVAGIVWAHKKLVSVTGSRTTASKINHARRKTVFGADPGVDGLPAPIL